MAVLPVRVADQCWHDRNVRINGRLEERGVKGHDVIAKAGRAFGEDSHQSAGAQFGDQVFARALRRGTRAALEKQGADLLGEPADYRPVQNVVLRKKCGWGDRVDGVNVEPGDVVGHQQAVARRCAPGPEPDAEHVKQMP